MPQAIPAHFINLDAAPGRRDWMQSQAAGLGVSIGRFAAVRASDLSDDDAAALRAPVPWQRPLSVPELACALSHKALWQRAADGEAPWAAVFEDDVRLSAGLAPFLADDGWIPAGADIVKLETFSKHVLLLPPFTDAGHGRSLARLGSGHVGGAGYILSRGAARRLAGAAGRWAAPVDQVLFNPDCAVVAGLTILQITPALCVQQIRSPDRFLPETAEGSTLRAGKTRRLTPAKAMTEALRPLRQVALSARMRASAAVRGGRWGKVPFAP